MGVAAEVGRGKTVPGSHLGAMCRQLAASWRVSLALSR